MNNCYVCGHPLTGACVGTDPKLMRHAACLPDDRGVLSEQEAAHEYGPSLTLPEMILPEPPAGEDFAAFGIPPKPPRILGVPGQIVDLPPDSVAAADLTHRMETFGLLEPAETPSHPDPLLAARGDRYGAFLDNAAISQALKGIMRSHAGWGKLDPDMREALEQACLKISRILCGDPSYADNWIDIAGYATRVADRLGKGEPS